MSLFPAYLPIVSRKARKDRKEKNATFTIVHSLMLFVLNKHKCGWFWYCEFHRSVFVCRANPGFS
jgi:hypothetical protein